MYGLLKSTLREGLENELKGNGFAHELMFLLENQPDIPSREQLANMDPTRNSPLKTLQNESGKDPEATKDVRFEALYVSGIRKFPSVGSRYTVKFTDNGEPVSSIILGINGVGKSTLYSSLEYISLGRSFTAEERGYKDDSDHEKDIAAQKKYLVHHGGRTADAILQLYTKNGERTVLLDQQPSPMVPPAFFCSEYDIQEISHYGLSSKYICNQLGLGNFHDLLLEMAELRDSFEKHNQTYIGNAKNIDELKKSLALMMFLVSNSQTRVRPCERFISNAMKLASGDISWENLLKIDRLLNNLVEMLGHSDMKNGKEVYSFMKEAVDSLQKNKDEYERLKAIGDEDSQRRMADLIMDCYIAVTPLLKMWKVELERCRDKSVYLYVISDQINIRSTLVEKQRNLKTDSPLLAVGDEYIELFNSTYAFLKSKYKELLQKYVGIINRMLPKVFTRYFEEDIKAISIALAENGMTIDANIYSRDAKDATKPALFLNTFRFKLFCFLLKFSLACCVKSHHRINFPFVVDDVFDASDFDNRTEAGRLISTMEDRHDDLEGMAEMPLQLIMFTQDTIIAGVIRKHSFGRGRVKLSRLFHYTKATDKDIVENEREGKVYVTIEDRL